MGNGPVIKDTTEDIDQDGDDEDDSKDAAGSDATGLMWFGVSAGMDGSSLEEVGAFVGIGSNKGDGGLRSSWVSIAEE